MARDLIICFLQNFDTQDYQENASSIRLIKRRSTFLKTIGKLKDKNLPVVDAFCLTPNEFIDKKADDGFFKDLVEKGIRVL